MPYHAVLCAALPSTARRCNASSATVIDGSHEIVLAARSVGPDLNGPTNHGSLFVASPASEGMSLLGWASMPRGAAMRPRTGCRHGARHQRTQLRFSTTPVNRWNVAFDSSSSIEISSVCPGLRVEESRPTSRLEDEQNVMACC